MQYLIHLDLPLRLAGFPDRFGHRFGNIVSPKTAESSCFFGSSQVADVPHHQELAVPEMLWSRPRTPSEISAPNNEKSSVLGCSARLVTAYLGFPQF